MKLFTPNTDNFTSFYDKAKFLLAWRISLIFSVVFAILLYILILSGGNAYIPGAFAFVISLGSLIHLHFTKKFAPLFWVYTICGTIIVHFSLNTIHEFTHFVDFVWMIAIIILAFIGLGKRMGFMFAILQMLALCYFVMFNMNDHLTIIQPRSQFETIGALIELVLAFIVITYLLALFINFSKYSENQLKKLNTELSFINTENTVLMKEIHHRVKNNLQIVTSLLRLQKSDIPVESQEKFDQAISRIMTMSLIHKKLYQTEELSNINTAEYLTGLIDEILSTYPSSKSVAKDIFIEIENIGLKTIVPLGLLVNELISNSFKHAFNDLNNGSIKISIHPTSTKGYKFSYIDNGTWIDRDDTEMKFGTELIGILTEQLEGDYKRESSEYTFNLKNLDI